MARLFNRQFFLNVGGVAVASSAGGESVRPTLGVAFKVIKDSQKEPNPAEVTIWNLTRETRAAIERSKELKGSAGLVSLDVGYTGAVFRLFVGDLIHVSTQRQGAEWVTLLQIHDGSVQYRSARINESMGPGTLLSDAIKKAADAMGLPLGNLLSHVTNRRSGWASFGRGVVLSGPAQAELDKLLRTAGYEWSIQDGQLQVLAPDETLAEKIVVLNESSGLIGSPERSTKEGETGHVKARSLLQPGLTPGRRVRIEGEAIKGDFKVLRTLYTGDSWGPEWYAEIEGSPVS